MSCGWRAESKRSFSFRSEFIPNRVGGRLLVCLRSVGGLFAAEAAPTCILDHEVIRCWVSHCRYCGFWYGLKNHSSLQAAQRCRVVRGKSVREVVLFLWKQIHLRIELVAVPLPVCGSMGAVRGWSRSYIRVNYKPLTAELFNILFQRIY